MFEAIATAFTEQGIPPPTNGATPAAAEASVS
jgi:hypothetical protein